MHNLWFISNVGSGTATDAKCEALEAVFAERGLALAGRTRFPDDALPSGEELAAAGVDTVVLFAGDGTINAAACKLATWDGAILILPGGTMNLLAKALHGDAAPDVIVHAAHAAPRRVALPFVEAGRHRAFVGVIAGPAADWVHAREAARHRRIGALVRAVRTAWRRTFGRGIRLGGASLPRAQAVFIRPAPDHLDVAAVDARDLRAIASLGWDWMTGDWVAAEAVTQVRAQRLTIDERKPVTALFDGEPETLTPGSTMTGGLSAPMFLSTIEEPA